VSDLPPPPAPPGAGPTQCTRTIDPWRKYLVPGLVGGVLVLIVIGAIAGLILGEFTEFRWNAVGSLLLSLEQRAGRRHADGGLGKDADDV
jgi:hypothetical protein